MQNWKERVIIDPTIRFGKPRIRNTRITVSDILGWLANGMTYDDIVEDFPELTPEDILASLAFAASREENVKTLVASV
jgi:uncharacterized protein (DUF433 family)